MQKKYRLTSNASFNYIYRKGERVGTKLFTLFRVPASNLKAGISVSTKVGNSVIRHRVKRRIGERFRLLIPNICPNNNFVIVAKDAAKDASSGEFEKELIFALKKLHAFTATNG